MPKNKIVKKSINDKFYTKEEVAKWCIEKVNTLVSPTNFLEPSAGNGAFSRNISNCHAIDIEPEHPSIRKMNYLKCYLRHWGKDLCVIGNPPFGERNNLTKNFIRHSMRSNVKWIAFVLPSVFKKFTNQRIFPDNWSLIFQEDLPHNSFLLEGVDYHVPCVFQIWEKNSKRLNLREVEHGNQCKDFKILKNSEKEDADVFVFGSAPHKIINLEDVKPNNRGYFLKSSIDKEDLMCKIRGVDWANLGNSSVSGGVFWISTNEFIKHYKEKWENGND